MSCCYSDFVKSKSTVKKRTGFKTSFSDSHLFDWQKEIVDFCAHNAGGAIFADCGLGKTIMQLEFAKNAISNGGSALVITPLAVAEQTILQGVDFGIEATRSKDGNFKKGITVTNYERLGYFNPSDFKCVVLDESSILKNYAGKVRKAITDFMQGVEYRLLCTATAAPNDYVEFGTSCEALGIMKRVEMLAAYFTHDSGETQKWALKGHAEKLFWEWMSTWARAIRKPSDLGYIDDGFILPEFKVNHIQIESMPSADKLFAVQAVGLNEQRKEKRESLERRCAIAAEKANDHDRPFISWCGLNDESALLTKLINGAVEIAGCHSDDYKEHAMMDFSKGNIRAIVTKPSIAGFGMNWQHCSDMSYFPTHSYEQFYQATRRCWRFGQKNEVNCNLIYTESERAIVDNLLRKDNNANAMYDSIISNMKDYQVTSKSSNLYKPKMDMEAPKWL